MMNMEKRSSKQLNDETEETKQFSEWVYKHGKGLLQLYEMEKTKNPNLEFNLFCCEMYQCSDKSKNTVSEAEKTCDARNSSDADNSSDRTSEHFVPCNNASDKDKINLRYFKEWKKHYEYDLQIMYDKFIYNSRYEMTYDDFVLLAYMCTEKSNDKINLVERPVLL